MGVDTSVRNANTSVKRMTDALLRATGGYQALFLMPPVNGDSSDAAQLGITATAFQQLAIAPAAFRRTRATMSEGQKAKYELLLSAAAVEAQITALQLSSADALFTMAAGVQVDGLALLIEGWSASFALGSACMYRLLLRAAEPESLTQAD